MGLNSLKNLANGLAATGANFKIGGFTANLPTLNIFNSNIESPSTGTFIASAGSIVQTLTQGAKGVMCIGTLLMNPDQMLKALNLAGDFILGLGLQLLNDVYRTCMARVNNILATSYGLVLGYFKTIKNIISAIQGVGDMLNNIYEFFTDRSKSKVDFMMKSDDCAYFIANILRCMIGKMVTPYLNELQLKADQKINNIAGGIENKITQNTEVLNSMSSYLNNQAMFVNKFTSQVNSIF